jgi:crossover junction endodeoxyribonuclease RusA
MTVDLPWIPSHLSPNARNHWAKRQRFFRAYKKAAYWLIYRERNHLRQFRRFRITFLPPDNHKRDLDNMIASFKAGIDALSDAIGIDDSEFSYEFSRGEPVKNGNIILEGLA